MYGSGENVRDWLHVEDHARALFTVLRAGEDEEEYNIGGGAERRNIDVVGTLCNILDEALPDPAIGTTRVSSNLSLIAPGMTTAMQSTTASCGGS